jgi:hypothetical protein
MPDNFGSAKASNKAPTKSLHAGLKTRAPKAPSGSFTKGGSVNHDTTRSSTAKTPKTLGPRTA